MGALDRIVFRWINGWPPAWSPFLTSFSVASDWKSFRIAMLLFVLGLIVRGRGRAALLALVAFPLADGLCNLAKHLLPMPRPFQALPDVLLRVGPSTSMGTASSHAANMAAVATVMVLNLGPKWGSLWILAALLVGLSRIYVGAHYPFQVLFGWTIGIGVGFAVDRFARRLLHRPENMADDAQPFA